MSSNPEFTMNMINTVKMVPNCRIFVTMKISQNTLHIRARPLYSSEFILYIILY